jgi:glucose/arabinose dehydrogenase
MFSNLLLSLLLAVQAPAGFQVDVFAQGLEGSRTILALEDGTVLVSRPAMNDVLALRDTNGDGIADQIRTAIASVEQAHGLAIRGRTLYVAGVNRIVAADRLPDGSFGEARELVDSLPAGGRRALGFGTDGNLYVAVGSACAECVEAHPEHATLLQFDPNGRNRRIFARGLGEASALDRHPRTGELWAAGGGELNRLGDGLNYGWPFCQGKKPAKNGVAPEGMSKEKFCQSSEAAALDVPSSARGFAFYRGEQFPEGFRQDAFAASGSKIVRIRFHDDQPAALEDFVSGAIEIAGLTATPDGALLFSDEASGAIYRVTYGAMPRPMMSASATAEPAAKPVLSQAFHVGDLRAPESVVHDEEQDVYFVSNKGFVSRISPEGQVTERNFIAGLDSPKGMAIRGAELWIADGTRLRAFDRVTGAELKKIELAEHGAVSLEDVAIGPDDAVYVTDIDVRIRGEKERLRQGDGRIFRVSGDAGEVEVAMAGEELRSPAGIAWDGTRFLIAQSYGNEVLAWNRGMGTKAVLRGPGAYAGIVVLPNGAVIVSSHYDDALHVGRAGELRPLFARKPSPGDIGFDRKRNRLLIPSSEGDWLEAWNLPPMEIPATRQTAKDSAMEMAKF